MEEEVLEEVEELDEEEEVAEEEEENGDSFDGINDSEVSAELPNLNLG